jgi:methylmalonyl-CoA/ethylmalonyl-CoA epimerase
MANDSEITAATAIHLSGVGQIAITVHDLAEAKRFYGEILGMTFLFDAGHMTFFQSGGIRFLLGLPEKPLPEKQVSATTTLYFRVQGLEAACAELKAKGAELVHDPHLIAKMSDHDLWMAFVKDPSGNILGLMSEVPRRDS